MEAIARPPGGHGPRGLCRRAAGWPTGLPRRCRPRRWWTPMLADPWQACWPSGSLGPTGRPSGSRRASSQEL
eukprot:4021470-Pyramimonas_sp.AAC.1